MKPENDFDAREHTQATIAKLAGWEAKDFQTFISRFNSTDVPTTKGTGDWRRYSLNQAIGFRAFAVLVEIGIPPRSIRGFSRAIDFAEQLTPDLEWMVIRRNVTSSDSGSRVTLGNAGWIGDSEYQAIGVSRDELVQAIDEAGDGAIVLHWKNIRGQVLQLAKSITKE